MVVAFGGIENLGFGVQNPRRTSVEEHNNIRE